MEASENEAKARPPVDLRTVAQAAAEVREKAQRVDGALQDLGTEPRAESVASLASHLACAVDDLALLVKTLAEEMRR